MPQFDFNILHRRSIRLKGYDYSQEGVYYLTICAKDRECLFGEVVDGEMRLSDFGEIVKRHWLEIRNHFHHIIQDTFVVMPNHVHGVLVIFYDDGRGTACRAPTTISNRTVPQTCSWINTYYHPFFQIRRYKRNQRDA